MRLLLDTHVWLWLQTEPGRVAPDLREEMEHPGTDLFLSAASAWEIAIKHGLGKLHLPMDPGSYVLDRMRRGSVTALVVTHEHALAVSDLPDHHRDPFDRLLVAQAQLEDLELVTVDSALGQYDVRLRWAAG